MAEHFFVCRRLLDDASLIVLDVEMLGVYIPEPVFRVDVVAAGSGSRREGWAESWRRTLRGWRFRLAPLDTPGIVSLA